MPIDNRNVIDFVSTDSDNKVVLIISDHYDWKNTGEHLLMLQEKINGYLEFMESEQIFDSYPKAISRKMTIEVGMKYAHQLMEKNF